MLDRDFTVLEILGKESFFINDILDMASVSQTGKLQRQDTGIVTNSTKKPLLNLFPQRNDCKYTPCYW